jgi:hypothetical protein
MNDPLLTALYCHNQAKGIQALASAEQCKHRQDILSAIAELYYLLHDKFVELDDPEPPRLAARKN